MTALVIVLILAVLVLAAVLFRTLSARRRDQRLIEATARSEADKHYARADATEDLAQERASRERAEAELHEARLRIVALEHRRDTLEADAGQSASRLGLFNRSSSEIPPEDTEQRRTGMSRGT
jgi:predicted Holliday junction resolvase-like endonuclease